jgi:hypothetical protein
MLCCVRSKMDSSARKYFTKQTGGVGDEHRKLHNEDLYHFYHPPDTINMMKENKLGRARSMHCGEANSIHNFCRETRREVITWKT